MKTVFTYAFIIGAAQGLLLAVFLLKKKENKTANQLLAVTMFLFAFDLVLEASAVTGDIKKFPILIGLMQAFPYIYGPSIYLYVYLTTRSIKEFNLNYLFHYTPFLLVQIYGLFFFYFEPESYQLNLVYVEVELPWHLLLVSYITPIYGGFCIALAVYESFKFNKELKNNFSNIDKHNLSWVTFLIIGSILLWVVAIFMTVLQIIYGSEVRAELISYLAITIFIYAMAYKGLRQPEIILVEKIIEIPNKEDQKRNQSSSYKKSGLTKEYAKIHLDILLKLMDDQKPFRNEKLNLSDLSKMVGISSHNLSEIINSIIKQNFYDFINSYRVEEVKKLIEKDEKLVYNILVHGMEAGFSSKSAYYSAFKKFTGKTPAQYRIDIF